jgi:hypothetical protein
MHRRSLDPGKLRDVLKNLNGTLGDASVIRFERDGAGKRVKWLMTEPERAAQPNIASPGRKKRAAFAKSITKRSGRQL